MPLGHGTPHTGDEVEGQAGRLSLGRIHRLVIEDVAAQHVAASGGDDVLQVEATGFHDPPGRDPLTLGAVGESRRALEYQARVAGALHHGGQRSAPYATTHNDHVVVMLSHAKSRPLW